MRAFAPATALVLLLAAVAVPPVARAADPMPAAGFIDEIVLSGFTFPTAVRFAPNGEIFVAEKSGLIKRFTGLADASPDQTADLRTQVFNYWDRGLLGLAVDPDYPTRPYIYALFSYDALIGGTAPKWGTLTNNGNDVCYGSPNGPGATTDGCVTSGRLVRLTVGANGIATAQKVLVEDWCGQWSSHSIGTVAFGPDGYLYAGGGDAASFAIINLDYGQLGGTVNNPNTGQPYTPRNPCGDPPGGVGGAMTVPTAEGGSLRSQDKRTNSDPTGLDGTIIRVDPDTGAAAPTNPSFAGGRDENDQRIIAYGLRNPYRFTFRPGTDELWIGDVGASVWDEIDRVVNATNPIRNFGWPCYEGANRNSGWDNLNINICENLYGAGASAVQAPYFAYRHEQAVFAGDPCPTGGGVISGIAFYGGGDYPARLDNALFFTDYARRCIWAARAGTNGLPDPTRIEVIEQEAAGPVDLQVGPDGDVFYVDHNGGSIHRLRYVGANVPPTVVATATPTNGPAPLNVSFDASGSSDLDGDPITFAWDLDGDTAYDDSNIAKPSRNYAAGVWHPAVRVSDDHGNSTIKSFTIQSGNSAPLPVIDTPSAGTLWNAGQQVSFSGHATDPDQGTLGAARLSWRVILHHCSAGSPSDCHEHNVQDFIGTASGTFQALDHDLPAHLELRLTATDSGGLSTTVSRTLNPRTVNLTFATSPSGLTVTGGGTTAPSPFTRTFIVNSAIALNAPTPQTKNGISYAFSSWSNGGTRSQTVHGPVSAKTYTASYTAGAVPPDVPNTCAGATTTSAQGGWLYNTLSSTSDVDWYRFNVPSQTWSRILLAGLPSNYRLDLYSACGTLVASSNRTGPKWEEIYRELAAGTYRVRVRHYSGGVSTTVPYGVQFTSLPTGAHILSSSAWTDSAGKLNVDGEVLNNTPDKHRLMLTATYYDAANQFLGKQDIFAHINVMRGRTRSPFRVSVVKPAGYDHYTVAITGAWPSTDLAIENLNVSSSSVVTNPGPSFRGNFTNQNGFQTRYTQSVVTLYDKWATVINVRGDWTSPINVNPGASGTYNSTFTEHYAGWNRAAVLLQASP
jgi:glucose/arabinose dehydrogenase